MTKMLSCIITMFLFIVITVSIVQAQAIDKSYDTSNTVDNKTIELNSTMQFQSAQAQIEANNNKYADIDKIFNDYLSGNTTALVIPGAIRVNGTVITSNVTNKNEISPDTRNITKRPGMQPLDLYNASLYDDMHNDPDWSNTYVYFGCYGYGNSNTNVTSIDGRVNSLNNLQDLGADELVMHFDALVNENDINIVRYGSNVKIEYAVNGNARIDLTFPAGDTYFMYVKAHNPIGTRFDDLDFYVYDYNTHQYNLTVLHSPVTQTMYRGDVALEKKYTIYDSLTTPPAWCWFYSFHVYDYNGNRLNLPNNGFVYEFVRPTVTNPSVHNIHYTDFVDYISTNGEGTIYMARYPVGTTPPAHP